MAKISRTYRLSKEALEQIDQRDKSRYPTANDFVESCILIGCREENHVEEVGLILQEIRMVQKEIREMKQLVQKGDYHFPNID